MEGIVDALGSVARAYRLLVKCTDEESWQSVRRGRSEDLLIYLALSRFEGRPKAGELPIDMQRDVKAFLGSYAAACRAADNLLFSLGRQDRREEAARSAPFGKLLPVAFYVHVDAVQELSTVLRLYEGCARAVLGTVDGATIVKLRRDEPKVSYLCYPSFDSDPHPELTESVSVHLQTFRVRTRRHVDSDNPPLLHRKEMFVSPTHPLKDRFERLTRAEERAGLLDDTATIGTRRGWRAALDRASLDTRGHRLIRRAAP